MRYYLPSVETLKQYSNFFQVMKGTHRLLSREHDWFIKFPTTKSAEPFYFDGTQEQAMQEALKESEYAEIINCNWIPKEWDATAWLIRVVRDIVTEEYRAERSDPHGEGYNAEVVGYKRDGEWLMKYYSGEYGYFQGNDKEWHLVHHFGNSSFYVDWNGEELRCGSFEQRKTVKDAPRDPVISVLKRMDTRKYRGFYKDVIDLALRVTGLERRLF